VQVLGGIHDLAECGKCTWLDLLAS
jgi:hypothetical protein